MSRAVRVCARWWWWGEQGGAERERRSDRGGGAAGAGAGSSGVSGGECEPRREPCCHQQRRAAQAPPRLLSPAAGRPRRCRRKTDAPRSPSPGSDPRSRQPSTPVSGASLPGPRPPLGIRPAGLFCAAHRGVLPRPLRAPRSGPPDPVAAHRGAIGLVSTGARGSAGLSARSLAGSAGKGGGGGGREGGGEGGSRVSRPPRGSPGSARCASSVAPRALLLPLPPSFGFKTAICSPAC